MRLNTLCDDVLFRMALFMSLDDLLSFSMSCKSVYNTLRCSDVCRHWLDVLPPALTHSLSLSVSTPRNEAVKSAIRRAQYLHSIWTGNSDAASYKEVLVLPERWGHHVAGTQWMFNYTPSMIPTILQCINLADGFLTGEMPMAAKLHSSTTLSGQIHECDQILLAMLCEQGDGEKSHVFPRLEEDDGMKRKWSLSLVLASFEREETGVKTMFTPLKSLSIPENIGCLFSHFDVLQIDGDYIVISGNWSTKTFLLIDWKRESMVVHRCPKFWRIFHWKLLASRLFIIYDDRQIDVIDVSRHLAPGTLGTDLNDFPQFMSVPTYSSIWFLHAGQSTFSTLLVAEADDSQVISHTQISLSSNGTAALQRGAFDRLSFPRGSHIHITSSGIVCKGTEGDFTIWTIKEGGEVGKTSLNLAKSQAELLDIDQDIGMIVLKEVEYGVLRAPQIKAYWVL